MAQVQSLARPQRANKRLKFLIGGLLILVAVAYLTVSALNSTSAYYRTPTEVLEQKDQLVGKPLRVSGKLLAETIVWKPKTMELTFEVSDDNGARLPIYFKGVKPDNMTEAAEVIVEGKLRPDGVVEAKSLLLKCPSRYEEGVTTDIRVESPSK
ncbi:MAG: cytochrome c maturation protein CcmE [Chloroflexi bacterium]|nr:cytochrome c maturation protein CcmE [Chloroflexota bacterium]